MALYLGDKLCGISLPSGKKAPEYSCLNTTGENISAGDKVFIASNANLKLVSYYKYIESIGYTGVASENISNGSSGKVSSIMRNLSPSLSQWDRVDNKATVVGFFTDENGTKYAVCVADAAYREGNTKSMSWNNTTPLGGYSTINNALEALHSASWCMEQINRNTYITNLPSFQKCYTKILTYDGIKYNGLLPNATELQMIFNNRSQLDLLDTSLSEYPSNSLSSWNFGNNSSSKCWCTYEKSYYQNYYLGNNNSWGTADKTSGYGVVPVFEIPVTD